MHQINNTETQGSINRGKENLKDGLLAPLAFLMLSIMTVFIIGSISLKIGENVLVGFLTPATIEALLILYILKKRKNYSTQQIKELLRLKKFKTRNIPIALGVALAFLIFSAIEQSILNNITNTHVLGSNTTKTLDSTTGITQLILLGFLAPFIAPIIEELFFRGLTMGLLENSNLKGKAQLILPVLTNATYFALLHCQGFTTVNDINVMVIVFILATINSILVKKTDSIYTSIMVHIFYNSIIAISGLIALH